MKESIHEFPALDYPAGSNSEATPNDVFLSHKQSNFTYIQALEPKLPSKTVLIKS